MSQLRAIPDNAAVLLVGDVDSSRLLAQGRYWRIPSVPERIPTVTLTEIFRQAALRDHVNAHRIKVRCR
jgi:exodeoxyribonuclease V alpha subunit